MCPLKMTFFDFQEKKSNDCFFQARLFLEYITLILQCTQAMQMEPHVLAECDQHRQDNIKILGLRAKGVHDDPGEKEIQMSVKSGY